MPPAVGVCRPAWPCGPPRVGSCAGWRHTSSRFAGCRRHRELLARVPSSWLVVGAMVAQRLARWAGPVPTPLVARQMALGAARPALCGRWGLCGGHRGTALHPKPVHIVQLRLVWLGIWCGGSPTACSRGMPASLAVWAAPGGCPCYTPAGLPAATAPNTCLGP